MPEPEDVGQADVAKRILAAARQCVGARFRVQGRDPAIGLDCVGLAAIAYRAVGATPSLPTGYSLRGGDIKELEARLVSSGFVRIANKAAASGDLLLLRPGRRQVHLAIHCGCGFIHADLGLRRVVETPGSPPWPVLGSWRWRLARTERKTEPWPH